MYFAKKWKYIPLSKAGTKLRDFVCYGRIVTKNDGKAKRNCPFQVFSFWGTR
jgi:hypothetical protein